MSPALIPRGKFEARPKKEAIPGIIGDSSTLIVRRVPIIPIRTSVDAVSKIRSVRIRNHLDRTLPYCVDHIAENLKTLHFTIRQSDVVDALVILITMNVIFVRFGVIFIEKEVVFCATELGGIARAWLIAAAVGCQLKNILRRITTVALVPIRDCKVDLVIADLVAVLRSHDVIGVCILSILLKDIRSVVGVIAAL